jgi:hypothetical protein
MEDLNCNSVKPTNLSDLEVHYHFFLLKNYFNIIISFHCRNSQRSLSKRFTVENAEYTYFFLVLQGLFILFHVLYVPLVGTDD